MRRISIIYIVSLFFIVLGSKTFASDLSIINVDGESHSYKLAGSSRYFRDDQRSLVFDEFVSIDKSSLPLSDPRGMVFGVTDFHYWFYNTVINTSDDKNFVLAFQYFGNGGAEVYIRPDRGEWQLIGEVERNIERHFFVPLVLNKDVSYELVIKSISPGPDKFHIHILNADGKEKFVIADNQWLGWVYGGLVTLLLFNIFVVFSTKSYSYASYVLYLASIIAFLLTLDGFGQIYIWGDNEEWSRSSYYALIGVFVTCGCLFSRMFLETKQNHPVIDKVLVGVMGLGMMLTAAELLFSSHPIFTNLAMLLAAIYAVILFSIGVIAYIKGTRVARYFLLAWLFPVFGVLYSTLMYGGHVPFDSIGYNMVHVTTLVQAILLSMALADRINFLQQEREDAINASKIRLEVSNRELEKANRLKNAFLGTISHELRTPMNGIIAGIPLLRSYLKGKEENELLVTMENSSESMLKMVDRILMFSEIQAGTSEVSEKPVNVSEWIENLSQVWRSKCKMKQLDWKLESDFEKGLGAVFDQEKVQLVLSELVSNAVKFTTTGSVILTVDTFQRDNTEFLRFVVEDTGIGIPTSRRLDVFKSFNQVQDGFDRQYEGLGIGLSLSKEIALMLKAHLKIHDSEQGCRMSFYFPLSRTSLSVSNDDSNKQIQASVEPSERQDNVINLNILVVEDNPVNQMIMKKILGAQGHDFELAEDGVKAVEASKGVKYDLILMDCQMPNMDGFEATRLIRSEESLNKETPIIAVTANAMEADRMRCLNAGMNDYLKKPVKPNMIDDAIRRWAG